ncbi:MAG: cysteine hydrolase [Pseudolabrys sp.]|nr:cysteine hydrolase [Pseudolabrys sp.]
MRNNTAVRLLGLDEKVNPAWTALVLVDVQNDFAKPAGACGQFGDDLSAVDPMLDRLKQLVEVARRKQILIIHVGMNNDRPYVAPNLAEMFKRRGLGGGPCLSNSYGTQFVDEVRPINAPNEIVLTKHRFSGFWGTSIDLMLRSNGIKTLVMTGIVSEVCVDSTARDGFFREYDVVVAGDCAASYSTARHDACHSLFARSFGVVAPSSEIANAWQNSNTTARGWQPSEKKQVALKSLEERVVPNHTALVVVGMQTSKAVSSKLKEALPRTKSVLDQARRAGVMIIHVQSKYGQEAFNVGAPGRYPDRARTGEFVRTLSAAEIGDTWDPATTDISAETNEKEFMDSFKPLETESVVVKHRFSAFCDTDLELLLRSNGIRTVVMMGQDEDCCLDTTAREATMKDYYLVVPEDCVVDEHDDAKRREVNLETLRRYFGLVCASQRLIAAWSTK